MIILHAFALFAGLMIWARSILFWLHFLQLKHYRLDRLWSEIKKSMFWHLILSKHRVIIIILLIGWFLPWSMNSPVTRLIFPDGVFIATASYLIVYLGYTIRAIARRSLNFPTPTIKMRALFISIFLLEIIILFYYSFGNLALVLSIEFLQPFIVLSVFNLVYTPNIFLHHYFINRAKKKIAAHENLIVIGITGSYGKTSTKEFLAYILSKKYKVLKTPAHINVDTGVARVIWRDLKPEHEIFIVEMGAYKKGEIKKIGDLIRPQYAILTGLSDQHLELFGSMQAIAEAKFELVEAVDDQARIAANADSELLVSAFKRRYIMPTWYGVSAHAARFKSTDIMFTENGTSFVLHGVHFKVPTIGAAALNNLLGAITMAIELGFHLKDIAPLVQDLPVMSHTMEPTQGPTGALIIDDTYNANTEGVITALNDLRYFNRARKLFVFKEVIELGKRTKEDHQQIARAIAENTSHTLLIPSAMSQLMYSTLRKNGYRDSQIIKNSDELKSLLDNDAVVLFEGREAGKILESL